MVNVYTLHLQIEITTNLHVFLFISWSSLIIGLSVNNESFGKYLYVKPQGRPNFSRNINIFHGNIKKGAPPAEKYRKQSVYFFVETPCISV